MKSKTRRLAGGAILMVAGISFLFPLAWMLLTSVKEKGEFYVNPFGLPSEWVFTNYRKVLDTFPLLQYLGNSVTYTAATCLITLTMGSMLAYCLSRMRFKLANQTLFFLTMGLVIPVQVVMIPLYMMVNNLGIAGTKWALILPYSAFQLPSTVLMMYAFLVSLPRELEEAAAIDGCHVFQGFFHVILPCIKAPLATRGVFIFIQIWNEFSLSQVLANTQKLRPLSVGLQSFFMTIGVSDWGMIGAAMILSSIPSVLVYTFGNRQIENALSAGAVLK